MTLNMIVPSRSASPCATSLRCAASTSRCSASPSSARCRCRRPPPRSAAMHRDGYTAVRLQTRARQRVTLAPATPPAPAAVPGYILDKANASYLTFIVDDLRAVVERLAAAGARLLTGPRRVEVRAGTGWPSATTPKAMCWSSCSTTTSRPTGPTCSRRRRTDMAILLRMPEVAANATHATLQAWTREEGETVAVGDCVAEIETDKAVVELNADAAGVLGRRLVAAGQEVEVGAPIGVLLVDGERHRYRRADRRRRRWWRDPDGGRCGRRGQPTPAHRTGGRRGQPGRRALVPRVRQPARAPLGGPARRRPRRAARQWLTAAWSSATWSRPRGGRPPAAPAAAPAASASAAVPAASTSAALPADAAFTEVPHSNMRRTIARRLSESKATIPHFYRWPTAAWKRCWRCARRSMPGPRARSPSTTSSCARWRWPCARCPGQRGLDRQRDAPLPRGGRGGGRVDRDRPHHPIVRGADRKPLSVISAEIADLAARARAGQLRPEEYRAAASVSATRACSA